MLARLATSIHNKQEPQQHRGPLLDTRVATTQNSVSRTFKRDGAYVTDPVIGDGAAKYTPSISERRGSTTTFLHSGMKNADAQTNTSGSVSASRVYDAFGAELSSTGSWQGRFGYAGGFGYQEDDGGFKLLGHRYFDPSTGRFLTRDPIKDGRNWYAYCGNSPISKVDYTGLYEKLIMVGDTKIDGDIESWVNLVIEGILNEDGSDITLVTSKSELTSNIASADEFIFVGHSDCSGNSCPELNLLYFADGSTVSAEEISKGKGGKFAKIRLIGCKTIANPVGAAEWGRMTDYLYGTRGNLEIRRFAVGQTWYPAIGGQSNLSRYSPTVAPDHSTSYRPSGTPGPRRSGGAPVYD